MGVEATIKEIAGELERIATTKTVVGDPITAAGKTIIPISRISMGFGAGGGEGKRDTESGYGGGGGAGAKIEPVAFIMLSEEEARIFRLSERSDAGSILSSIPDLVPEIMDKLKGMRGKNKKEEEFKEQEVKGKETPKKETVEGTEVNIEEGGCFH
ncbi:sporulation protein [Methanosarcina spelaei]|uniref:Sporulation protein n=1 Tax=Methanosarcina spelaei TaxID=1036679 RepID=A0A2A2HVL7_9EURY|nr:spore germination protein GerW family protein [Methanosarcina spelaei]PAV13507.1 sporulation protein [Methanosarcina spelaei]